MGQKYASFAAGLVSGFYDSEDSPLPQGVVGVAISDAQWLALLAAQSLGKVLRQGADGLPEAGDPPPVAPVVPSSVTMRQARLALLNSGKLAAVDAAISTLPSPEREAAQIEWAFASTVDRDSPIVALMGPALDLDEAALDALFTQAIAL